MTHLPVILRSVSFSVILRSESDEESHPSSPRAETLFSHRKKVDKYYPDQTFNKVENNWVALLCLFLIEARLV